MSIKKTALAFAIMVIAFGCTSTPVAVTPTESADISLAISTPPETYKFTIATGTADSDWHIEGNGLSAEINTQIPAVFSSIKETENLMENVDLLTSGKAGLVFVYDFHVALANRGKLISAFPDAPIEKIVIKCGTEMIRPMFPDYAEAARIVLPLYEEQLHVVASETSSITSVIELKGKHISTGETGSATEQQARFIITGLGIDWENGISREQFDLSTAIHALKNKEIDAFVWSGHPYETEISDFLNLPGTEFKLIPITGDEAEMILQSTLGIFHQSRIPAGTYISVGEDVETLATTVVLAAMEDFSEDHVTQILAAFFDSTSAVWKSRFPTTSGSSAALLNVESQSYLHQGTVEYFTKQGVLK